MAVAQTTKMYNPSTGTYATVLNSEVSKKKAAGYTTSLPSSSQVSEMIYSANKGVQKYYTPTTGVTETAPVKSAGITLDKERAPLTGFDEVYTGTAGKATTTTPTTGVAGTSTTPSGTIGNASSGSGVSGTAISNNSAIQDMINKLIDTQKESQLSALESAYKQNLSTLTGQEASTQQQYYDTRNQIASTSAQEAKKLTEMLAASGLGGSGASAQAQLSQQGALQGNLTSANVAENQALSDIATQRANLGTAYSSDVATAESGLEAQRLQSLIDQYNQQQSQALQEAQLTGTYNGNLTLAGQQAAQEAQQQQVSDYTSTINQYYQDYQKQIDALTNDGDTTNDWQIPYLKAARQQKIADIESAQAAAQQYQDQLYQQQVENALTVLDKMGYASGDVASILGLPEGSTTLDYVNMQIDNAVAQGQLSVSQANAATSRARLAWEQDPNNVDNILKAAQIEKIYSGLNEADELTVDDMINQTISAFDQSNYSDLQAYNELKDNASAYINDMGLSGYNSLISYYNSRLK